MKHFEAYFKGQKDFNLYYQGWIPDGEIKAVIILAHGIAEHTGRYQKTATFLAMKGYAVYSHDLRGHGRSEGKRGYVEHFSYFLDDFRIFHSLVQQLHPNLKIILFGHSMGAAIVTAYAASQNSNIAGIILSAMPVKAKPQIPAGIIVALKPLAVLTPKIGLFKLDSSTLSKDKNIRDAYDSDPFVFRGKLSARLLIEFLWMLHGLPDKISTIQAPALILHGTADNLCSPEGSQITCQRIGSQDKTLILYPGLFHEIFNEPEQIQVYEDVEVWLNRINSNYS